MLQPSCLFFIVRIYSLSAASLQSVYFKRLKRAVPINFVGMLLRHCHPNVVLKCVTLTANAVKIHF